MAEKLVCNPDWKPPEHWTAEMVERFRPMYPLWWPPELYDCEWRTSPNLWLPPSPGRPGGTEMPGSGRLQVRPKGAGDDAWRDVPADPLDETQLGD